jgi:beta-galactosidase
VIKIKKNQLINDWEFYKGSLGGIWEVWREELIKNHFNVSWNKVKLPHCYNEYDAVDPYQKYYQGPAWYRNKLTINNPYPQGRTLLHFEGAGQKTEVYLYKNKIAEHLGAYNEFKVDLTEELKSLEKESAFADQVPIAIKTDNSRDLETIPSDISDFNLYGGIYRYLNLIYLPAISIERVKIDSKNVSNEKAEVKLTIYLYNPDKIADELDFKLLIKNTKQEIVKKDDFTLNSSPKNEVTVNFTIENPDLWSPENPNLYSCLVKLKSEYGETEVEENFGLRYFEFIKKGPFKLNGRRLLLRGTHRHEDHAGVGAAMTYQMIEKEMNLIKEMGVNFIRLGHYQQSRYVLELCDKLGILVWEEIPWCRGGLGGTEYQKQAVNMLESMIDQHYNHPSIIIWGLGNENDWEADFDYFNKKEIRNFMFKLNELAHNLDKTRKTAIRRCDFCSDIVDIYSPSIWAGWYGGVYTEYQEASKNEFEKVDHFLHVEWGADNLAGRHVEDPFTGFDLIEAASGAAEKDGDYFLEGGRKRVSRDGDWSEDYFCELIDWHLKEQEDMDWLTGTAQWPFKDFSTPVRPKNPIPYMNLKGVVERDLTKKEGYYVFQSYWSEKAMIHIQGASMDLRWGQLDELKTIKVYSNCSKVELFLNQKSLGIKKRNYQDFPAAGLRWQSNFKKGINKVEAVGYNDGVEVLTETEFIYQTEKWGFPSQIELEKHQVDQNKYFIEAKVYDENNIFCPDADFFVEFDLTGDGKLLDNLGVLYGSKIIQLASGRAGIFVEQKQGTAIVSIKADKIKTKFVEI